MVAIPKIQPVGESYRINDDFRFIIGDLTDADTERICNPRKFKSKELENDSKRKRK